MAQRTPTHRADGPAVIFRGSRVAPRALMVGGALAATAAVGLGVGPASADQATWDRVAQCESTGRWDIVSRNGHHGGHGAPASRSVPVAQPAPAPAPVAGSLAVDGRFGPATTRALQGWAGVRADGSLSRSDIRAIQDHLNRG